ncbi:MAG: CotH kinase family protein [Bacteroidetes Order II. Incertae sedis bacterium]|nr:CotH kinase family protein [Bacteroidetes Order II. bacterium]
MCPFLSRCSFLISVLAFGVSSFAWAQFTDSNLPIIRIDTGGKTIVDEPRIVAKMEVVWNGPGKRNALNDPANHYDGPITIEFRGSTSQDLFPKKPYGLDTILPSGENNEVSLFGMPKGHDWVLNAAYNDKTLLRDVLAFKIARDMGGYWAPRTQFVELAINGRYEGVYVFMEQIKRGKDRVNISKLTNKDLTGDALTGGYILKVDKLTGDKSFSWTSTIPPKPGASQRITYQVEYPDLEDLAPEQKTYIRQWMTNLDTDLNSIGWNNPTTGYRKYIDTASMVDYLLLNEVTKNIDGYRLSAFMFKDRDSKDPRLRIGPPWDYNLTFGNADYHDGNDTNDWVVLFNQRFNDNFYVPFWWAKIWQDTNFQNDMRCRWLSLRGEKLTRNHMLHWVDSMAVVLNEAQKRNFQRWPIMGKYVWPNGFVGTSYASEIDFLRSWLLLRIGWIDENLPGSCTTANIPPEMREYDKSLHVYPNPFSDKLTLRYDTPLSGMLDIELFSVLGRRVMQKEVLIPYKGSYEILLPIEALAPGIYLGTARLLSDVNRFKVVKNPK